MTKKRYVLATAAAAVASLLGTVDAQADLLCEYIAEYEYQSDYADAYCSSGKYATGGGFSVASLSSIPIEVGWLNEGWSNTSAGDNWWTAAYSVCCNDFVGSTEVYSSTNEAVVDCGGNGNSIAVGGGGWCLNGGVLTRSYPEPYHHSTPTKWHVRCDTPGVYAMAVCTTQNPQNLSSCKAHYAGGESVTSATASCGTGEVAVSAGAWCKTGQLTQSRPYSTLTTVGAACSSAGTWSFAVCCDGERD